MIATDPRRLLLKDAALLIRQYRGRNRPGTGLDAAQRRRWAAEAVDVLVQLGRELHHLLGEDLHPLDTHRTWDAQATAGCRRASWKPQVLVGARPHSDYPESWPADERARWAQVQTRATEVLGYMEGSIWLHNRQAAMGWKSPGEIARDSDDGLQRILGELDLLSTHVTPGRQQSPRRPGKRG